MPDAVRRSTGDTGSDSVGVDIERASLLSPSIALSTSPSSAPSSPLSRQGRCGRQSSSRWMAAFLLLLSLLLLLSASLHFDLPAYKASVASSSGVGGAVSQPTAAPHWMTERPTQAVSSSALPLPPPPSLHRQSCERRYPLSNHSHLTPLQPSPRVFIALNLHNSASILPALTSELLRLLTALCDSSGPSASPHPPTPLRSPTCPNVYVSIYESDSTDDTAASLDQFAYLLRALSIPHTVSTHAQLRPHTAYRIDHLAAVRNFAMAPLYRLAANASSPPFTAVLFLNDVLFCAEDALRLLALAQVTGAHMACGLDFDDVDRDGVVEFYDTWVTRDRRGGQVQKRWPFLVEEAGGREVKAGQVVPVFCCWNGMVAMSAQEWWQYDLRFRAHDAGGEKEAGEGKVQGSRCEASEASHVCEDFHAIHGAATRIVVDPTVHVAYEQRVYSDIERQPWWREQQVRRMQNDSEWRAEVQRLFGEGKVEAAAMQWDCCDLAGHCSLHEVDEWKGKGKAAKRY